MKRYLPLFLALLLCLLPVLPAVRASEPISEEDTNAIYAALLEADLSELRQAIDSGFISCEDLTVYYLERIETYNDTYNCFITLCDDALEQAREKDRLLAEGKAEGSLFGIPIVVKDNIYVKGYLVTNGLKKSDSKIATYNADVVENLLAEGAIILGKTNMSTEATYASHSISLAVGETKNAYNPALRSGGSSGGSAVATSLNFAAASLGTDTRSSLRIPAALNGCVSLRLTKGKASQKGLIVVSSRRDTAGAITRTVKDQAIMLDAMLGTDYTENLNGNALEGLRIGILTTLSQQEGADPEITAAFNQAVENLRSCGVTVIEVSMPELEKLSEAVSKDPTAKPVNEFAKKFRQLLEKHDIQAVIFPSYLHAPQYSGTDADGKNWDKVDQAWINNCSDLSPNAGIPEISIPIGCHSRGAGIGMEIAAARDQEQLLLDIAYSYTQQFDQRRIPARAVDLYREDYIGSLTKLMESYENGSWPIAETEPTEPETAPTEAPTTVPETEVPTTVPETAASTAAATTLAPETQPEEIKTPSYGTLAVTLGVTSVCLGAVILLVTRHKKKEKITR